MATFTGSTQKVNITSPIDRIGQLINLHRLPSETLKEFKLRVLDNYIHPANSTYNGLYAGISRELGQEAWDGGIIIDVERLDGIPLIDSGFTLVVEERGILSNSNNPSIMEQPANWDLNPEDRWSGSFDYIARWDRTSSYFLTDLITNLNLIDGIEAVTWGNATDFMKSSYLKKITSDRWLYNVPVNQTNLQTFYDDINDSNWIKEVFWSSDTGITDRVLDLSLLADCDEYFLAEFGRTLHTYQAPISGTIDVRYAAFPLIIPISTVSIRSLRDPDVMDMITEQSLDVFGDEQDHIPTVEGSDFVNELYSVTPMYWNE